MGAPAGLADLPGRASSAFLRRSCGPACCPLYFCLQGSKPLSATLCYWRPRFCQLADAVAPIPPQEAREGEEDRLLFLVFFFFSFFVPGSWQTSAALFRCFFLSSPSRELPLPFFLVDDESGKPDPLVVDFDLSAFFLFFLPPSLLALRGLPEELEDVVWGPGAPATHTHTHTHREREREAGTNP